MCVDTLQKCACLRDNIINNQFKTNSERKKQATVTGKRAEYN